MIRNAHCLFAFVVFISYSCSSGSDEEVSPDKSTNNIYLNFSLQGTSYEVSRANYSLSDRYPYFECAESYISGAFDQNLIEKKEANFVTSVSFRLTKKVFKDELDPENDLSYLNKVINASSIGFPINQNGYYEVYDLENDVFEVSRTSSAEAYLYITTKDKLYRSSSVVPNERDPSSFIRIEKVIENTGEDSDEYPYIIEGTFAVNMFEGHYGTSSQIVEGSFRWPMGRIENSRLLSVCN